MSINETNLISLIKKTGLIDPIDLQNSKSSAQHLGVTLADVLIGKGLLTEDDFGKILAEYFNSDFIDLKAIDIKSEILNIIPEDIASEKQVIAFDKNGEYVSLATSDPKNLEVIEMIKKVIGSRRIKLFVASPNTIRDSIKGYRKAQGVSDDKQYSESTQESAVPLVNRVLEKAVREEASDIHIEPLEEGLLIRIRVDGVLHDEGMYEKSLHASVVARLKILSDLKLDEQRLPQDGQFAFRTKSGDKISLRVSISPTVYGEKAVLRILHSTVAHYNLTELGFTQTDLDVVQKALEKTHGMFLVTGPTGSGKTTTLYTILGILNKSDVNIITVEDPVENKINRVNQIQVNSAINLTFASGLRSILRQDPDIIMVGEIRDKETANIAVNAAMTGHLVFSTVHANNASGVIPRMVDLGAEPFLLASTLNLVLAQRLVRVLCPRCKVKVPLTPLAKRKMDDVKAFVSPDIYKSVKMNYQKKGCQFCFNTGYKGRIGIFEILPISENIKEMIINKSSAQEIWTAARKTGFRTMTEDGFLKVANGQTTLEEVFRVISQ